MEIDDQISNGNLFYLTTILSLLSLMGIPPMLGFFAKLKFISSLINDGNISSYIGIFAIFLSSVLGSYYYLKLPIKWILNSEKIEKNYNHINIAYNIAFILSLVLFFGFLAV
jgi:NADH:ubiquinone oxidoreductase subunit 2 (subunit N)